jgi:hypothetical protein
MINNIMKTHKHHIIPKHAGGTDNPENLIELTILEHAEAHRILYETYNRWQDRVAWLSLSGIMKDEERIYEILKNSNPGGYKHTEATKEKLSIAKLGEKNPMFRKPSPVRGKKRPGIGGRKKGTKWSDQERANQELSRSVEGYYDFLKDPARCKKISDSKKGCIGSAKGKHWYNNGVTETYNLTCPDGYQKGRLYKVKLGKRGLVWYNNGVINKQFKENTQPEEFNRGRISKK